MLKVTDILPNTDFGPKSISENDIVASIIVPKLRSTPFAN